jgi:ribosomal protein S18 acetylase RimI-like enzyme
MTPHHHKPEGPALDDVLALIRRCFAYMDDRVDPPSSIQRMSLADLENHCSTGEVWSLGTPPVAAVLLSFKADALYLGKLAVAPEARGSGLARQLIALAKTRARARRLPTLELQTRVELTENHATFRALGFAEIARTAHKGFSRPTSITFRKSLTA